MRLCFNIGLPDTDIRVGGGESDVDGSREASGFYYPSMSLDMSGRSVIGYEGREYRRFFPLILCLETLCQINEWQLARHSIAGTPLPRLYESGVRYEAEPPGEEEWLDTETLYRKRKGDCEDVACARVGELRFYDREPAVPCIKFQEYRTRKGRLTLVHVMVLRPNDCIEDPSRLLGMKGAYQ